MDAETESMLDCMPTEEEGQSSEQAPHPAQDPSNVNSAAAVNADPDPLDDAGVLGLLQDEGREPDPMGTWGPDPTESAAVGAVTSARFAGVVPPDTLCIPPATKPRPSPMRETRGLPTAHGVIEPPIPDTMGATHNGAWATMWRAHEETVNELRRFVRRRPSHSSKRRRSQ